MNYLAHTLLTAHDDEILFGNLIADTISNAERDELSDQMKIGVKLHRFIDSYTDEHAAVRICTAILREHHGKYAPVVFDLCSDYLLSESWSRYTEISRKEIVENAYKVIKSHLTILSQRRQDKFRKMIHHDFLQNSVSLDRLGGTLEWMDRRAKFPSNFYKAIKDLEEHSTVFNKQFGLFFPSLIDGLAEYKSSLQA